MKRSLTILAATLALAASGLTGLAPVALAAPAPADTVLEWNVNATTAIVGVARQPPHAAILSFAMVQGAVYDAVNAIDRGHRRYLRVPPASRWASKPAAAATAAYRVLVGLFPAQQAALQAQHDASLAAIPAGRARTAGVAAGERAAAAMLAARANDGRGAPFTFVIGTEPGTWRPTPPAFALDPAAWVGNVRPFVLPRGDMFRSRGPNALTSAAYAREFNEVKAVGSLTSTTRTANQTDAGIFWQDNGAALWNRILRALATDRHLGIADAARLFAMANLAGADGAIACWNDKYYWNSWRPITAIREAGSDGNPATSADPTWVPLFATPPFPEHPSGHGCVSGAIVTTLRAFFGTDRIAFSAFSNNSQTTRSFSRLSAALTEVIDARVWSGIHWRTADEQGARIGRQVAGWLTAHRFQPTR